MTLILGIDTSTTVCVGLARSGKTLAQVNVGDSRSHAELLMPTINQLMTDAGVSFNDLDAVALGVGPGPFTGLRVGIVTGKTLAFLAKTELYGVCSLDVVAKQWQLTGEAPEKFIICSDARRKELYWAVYDSTGRTSGPEVSAPERLPDLPIAGPGAHLFPEVIAPRVVESGPTALDAGVLASFGSNFVSAGLKPLYLRKPDAKIPGKPKSAIPTLIPHHRRAAK